MGFEVIKIWQSFSSLYSKAKTKYCLYFYPHVKYWINRYLWKWWSWQWLPKINFLLCWSFWHRRTWARSCVDFRKYSDSTIIEAMVNGSSQRWHKTMEIRPDIMKLNGESTLRRRAKKSKLCVWEEKFLFNVESYCNQSRYRAIRYFGNWSLKEEAKKEKRKEQKGAVRSRPRCK